MNDGLPIVPLRTDSVEVGGKKVSIKALTRKQALALRPLQDDPDEAEAFIIACGTGLEIEDVRAWRDTTDIETVGILFDAIAKLSGLIPNDPN